MANQCILPQDPKIESNDTPKKFTNTSNKVHVIRWDGRVQKKVKPGQTVLLPKYLVNYASYQLSKLMVKEEKKKGLSEDEIRHGKVNYTDPEMQKSLAEKMVAANFEGEEGKKEEADSSPEEKQEEGVKCEICGFVAKNEFGLRSHMKKHKNEK